MAEQTIDWVGQSGEKYKYWIYEISTTFKKAPANYIFAKTTSPETLKAIYIGEAEDISERFDNHHKMPCIRQNGATDICVHKSSEDKEVRCKEEADLIANYRPVCNG